MGGTAARRGLGTSPATGLTPQTCPGPEGQIAKVNFRVWLRKHIRSLGLMCTRWERGPEACARAGCRPVLGQPWDG